MSPLTDFERFVLDFERVLRRDENAKEEAIWRTFAASPARYVQFLDRIIRKEAALEHDPLLVRRLRRTRAARTDLWRTRWRPPPKEDREA